MCPDVNIRLKSSVLLGGSCQTEFELYFEAQIIKVELDLG